MLSDVEVLFLDVGTWPFCQPFNVNGCKMAMPAGIRQARQSRRGGEMEVGNTDEYRP